MITTPTGDAETIEGLRRERDEARAYLKAFVRATIDPEERKQDVQVHQANPTLGWVFTLNDTGLRKTRQILGSQIRRAMEIVGFNKLNVEGPPTTLADEHIEATRRAARAESRALALQSKLAEAKGALGTALSEMLEARDRLLASGARTSGLDFGIEEAHKALANLETKEPSDV